MCPRLRKAKYGRQTKDALSTKRWREKQSPEAKHLKNQRCMAQRKLCLLDNIYLYHHHYLFLLLISMSILIRRSYYQHSQ